MSNVTTSTGTAQILQNPSLIQASISGNKEAKELLAKACLMRVRKTVLLCNGGRNDVDDLVQTILIKVFGSLSKFRGDAKFTTWLDRITINAVREHYRRKIWVTLFANPDNPVEPLSPEQNAPDNQLENKRFTETLMPYLASIKSKKRIALVLATAYGYTVSEIAELMDCSTETAKKRLQHGRRELLNRIAKDPYLSQLSQEVISEQQSERTL